MKSKVPPDKQAPPAPSQSVIIYDMNASSNSSASQKSSNTGSKDSSGSRGDMSLPIEFRCEMCRARSFNLKSCSRCWRAKYCDNICQRRHWPQHELECVEDPKRRHFLKGGHLLEIDMITGTWHNGGASADGQPSSLDLVRCPKHGHNNHSAFIAVSDLNRSHLPVRLRLDEVLHYVLAEAQMTVRVMVYWTSKERPGEDVCAKFRGYAFPRAATGKVVLGNMRDRSVRPCPIPDCHRNRDLGPGHRVYDTDLRVITDARVVFNEEELGRTAVDFFYDSGNGAGAVREYGSCQLCPGRLALSGAVQFSVTVHDGWLLEKLEYQDALRSACFKRIPRDALRAMCAHALVISHPHGMPKRISVGNVVKIMEENRTPDTEANARTVGKLEAMWLRTHCPWTYAKMANSMRQLSLPVYKVWYDAATCLGCTGAPVLFGARETAGVWGPYEAQHTAYDIDSKLNYFKVPRFVN